MEKILNFNEPLDVNLLDRVVHCMYTGTPQENAMAQKVLSQFQQHPDAWTRVSIILQQAQNINSKVFGLQILNAAIRFKWNILPANQRDGIKNFVLNEIITKSKSEQALLQERVYIQKLNETLVQIAKQEWPHNWKNFIQEIVNASKSDQNICENNINILKLLSEEIFDFSSGTMTQQKIRALKEQFTQDFSLIYQLCEFVLDNAKKPALISSTLTTLLKFMNWIPLGYVFETRLLEILITKYISVAMYRNDTVKCLTEIASIEAPKYDPKFEQLFYHFMKCIVQILPPQTNIPQAFSKGNDYDQKFIEDLAIFFTSFFRKHLVLVEKDQYKELILLAHNYLVEISKCDDNELFKVCLEYWNFLAQDLYLSKQPAFQMQNTPFASLMVTKDSPRKRIYAPIMSKVRHVMISKMAKPEEVIIVQDDNGDVVKEQLKDVDSMHLYNNMKETLIYLTHLDYEDTEQIMISKLQNQVNGSEWSWQNLSTLSWAIGSISGAMNEKDEKRFLVTVIKDLLGLCEQKRGKQNKAVVASNIMYVVGQYPRFLVAHWKFLKTVVRKLFEFMHEDFPGVQEMACETFLKIAKKCKKKFVILHQNETQAFVDEMLGELAQITSDLSSAHLHIFYESVGHMIASAEPNHREAILSKLMNVPNQKWKSVMAAASQSIENLKNIEHMKTLIAVLKTNVATARSAGPAFISQLSFIFREMLETYKVYSQFISSEVARLGPQVTQHIHVRYMRLIKREVLKLVETFLINLKEVQAVSNGFVPPLLEATLGDYKNSVPDARDPGVLSLLSVVIAQLKDNILNELPKILEYVLECTLPMITKNFQDYPEHRINLYELIRTINHHCFAAFFKIPPQGFKIIIDSIMWASKHAHRSIYETGLKILKEMLDNVNATNNPQLISGFYQAFFVPLLNDVLYVMTDSLHLASFKKQIQILQHLFLTLKQGKIMGPIYDVKQFPTCNSNPDYIREYMTKLFCTSFPNISANTVNNFFMGLYTKVDDLAEFKNHIRDFLVQLREFTVEDQNNLYFEQKKAQQQVEKQKQQIVPGLVQPEVNDLVADQYDPVI